jgi:transposase
MKKYRVFLNGKKRSNLRQFVNTGTNKARTITRARILILSDESPQGIPRGMGKTDKEIMGVLGVSAGTVASTRQRYVEEGIESALNEKPRPGRPPKLTGRDEAKLAVIACSEPPEGRARWSVRLLTDKLIELDIVDSISREAVRQYIKKGMVHRQNNRRISGLYGGYTGSV